MKRLVTSIILLLAVVALNAQPAELLKKANELYSANKIQEAITSYESILKQGYESGALYYNLGNAYYKTDDKARAILYFERAKLFIPGDDDVQFNLELANQFVVDKINPLPRPFFVKWGQGIVNSQTANGWAVFSIVTFILLLVGAAGYIFLNSPGLKKISFVAAAVMLVFSLSTFGCASKQKSKITHRNHAIVFSPTVTVKASPDESGTSLFVIHEGVKIEIKEELSGWANIKLEDGNSGWVKKEVFERI